MLNVVLLAIAGLTILGIARFNKSNKLFWQLFISFVFGLACGQLGKYVPRVQTTIKQDTTIVAPMHQSCAYVSPFTMKEEMPQEIYTTLVVNYASQSYIDSDIVSYVHTSPSAPLEENKGAPPLYADTS